MGNKCLYLLLGLVFFMAKAQALTMDDLQTVLGNAPLIRGDFTQTKTLKMLNSPLKSKGNFLLQKEKGLLWQQTQPFPVLLVLSDQILYQKMPGQGDNLIHAKDNPLPFYFSRLFLDLFNGNTKTLADQFSLSLKGDAKKWTLTLTPSKPPLDKVFTQIVLEGNQNLNALSLEEIRGDKTHITFTNIRHTPLNDEERRAFIH